MGWEAVGLSLSLRGATFARSNDRGLAPAPEGALCEKCPPIRPYLVVTPSGAAFGAGVRVSERLSNSARPLL